jgi:ATP-dependent RNA helicase DeaD
VGVRPADIVGAIAGETGIPGQAIGAIDLYDRFAFVEVPDEHADRVIAGMRRVKIRNRPVTVKLATPRAHDPGRARRQARPPLARKRRPAA